jgi:hypothetical protein
VWRRSTDGTTFVSLLDGFTPTFAALLFAPAGTNWRLAAFTDVNNDGKVDSIYRDQTGGLNIVIYQNGLDPVGAALLPTVRDTTWNIIGPH